MNKRTIAALLIILLCLNGCYYILERRKLERQRQEQMGNASFMLDVQLPFVR
jgi:hypothetical protein